MPTFTTCLKNFNILKKIIRYFTKKMIKMFLKAKKSQKIKQISSFRYVFIVSFKANLMLKYKSIILVVSVHPIVDSATNQTGKYFVCQKALIRKFHISFLNTNLQYHNTNFNL